MAKRSKKGLPKSVQEALEIEETKEAEPTLAEFVKELHGDAAIAKTEGTGMPSMEWLQEQFQTKSAIIRYLINQRYDVKDIAKTYGFRYQHVRNVATSPLKRGPNEDWRKPLMEGSNLPNIKDPKPD